MLCDQLDDLTLEHKQLIFTVLEKFSIAIPDKNTVKFERIGATQGYNSAIHRVDLDQDRSLAIKITNHEFDEVVNILHNRELEFYEWLEGSKDASDPADYSHILKFYGGTKCGTEPGVIILSHLPNRVDAPPNYSLGFQPEFVFHIVQQIAAYQSLYLCSGRELSEGRELMKFDLPVRICVPKLRENTWMTQEEKDLLTYWTLPENWFAIFTKIPEGIEGVAPVLVHCDLWQGNMLFRQQSDVTLLSAFIDWQTFKIGNPLIDVASMLGLNMTVENRREYTESILKLYVDEMERRKGRFKKPFDMTMEKGRA